MIRRAWIPAAAVFTFGVVASELLDDFVESSTSIAWISTIARTDFSLNSFTLGLLVLGLLSVFYLYFSEEEKRLTGLLEKVTAELKLVKGRLHDASQLRYEDRTTRIPNEDAWVEEIKRVSSITSAEHPFHIAMVDLNDFGSINEANGYSSGDTMIRFIARRIHKSMRRAEHIYKTDQNDVPDDYYIERIYRKFSGGDEFLLIVAGPEFEAIGLLNRIYDMKPIFDKRAKELGLNWEFDFDAGVCPVQRDDTPALAKKRVEDCLSVARRKEREFKVYWHSELDPNDANDIQWKTIPDPGPVIYRKALSKFARSSRT